MSQEFTAEEVRAEADFLSTYSRKPSQMLTAYADLLERIKADEGAVPVAMLRHFNYSGIARNGFSQEAQMLDGAPELPDGTELFTRPPAQAAQVDSANWFAGKYPTTAELAQPTDSGRADLWVVFDEVASWLPYGGNRIRERFSEACAALAAQQAALAAQGQGEPVAWQYRRLTDEGWGIWFGLEADHLETVRRRTDCEVRALGVIAAAPSAPEGDA